jgi:hypothetical protein
MYREDAARSSLQALDEITVELVGVRPAAEVVPWVGPRRYLHAGPPLALDELPGPMRGALLGALVLEGEAAGLEEAEAIVAAAEVELQPCHDHRCVGAMAGIVTPRTPLAVVAGGSRRAFSPLNEGLGRALRFGSNDPATLDRLRWMSEVEAPVLDAAIAAGDPIDLTALVAEGLRRGDECHNRNVASTALLMGRLAPTVPEVAAAKDAAAVLRHGFENRHFFLPFSIATGKLLADAAHGIAGSPIVTAMAGNGRRFGIRVSGTGETWFTAAAPLGEARFFEGYTAAQATPAMGDSYITETAGWGAFALDAAPAIVSFVGGTVEESRAHVQRMRSICAGESSRLLLPYDSFRGTPLGIDVLRVAELGETPVVNNGIAHVDPGVGQVGAGITVLPSQPFLDAAEAVAG